MIQFHYIFIESFPSVQSFIEFSRVKILYSLPIIQLHIFDAKYKEVPLYRYMLLIYCNFWSQERQDRLRGEMNRYMASYNMASSGSGSAGNAMASTESNNPMGNEMHATNSDGLNGKVHDTCNILVDKSHSNEVVTCITDISRHSKDINQSEPTELNHKKKLYE